MSHPFGDVPVAIMMTERMSLVWQEIGAAVVGSFYTNYGRLSIGVIRDIVLKMYV